MNYLPVNEGRWDLEYAAHIHRILDDSGLSLAEFARRHGLAEKRLRWWRGQLRQRLPAETPDVIELVPTRSTVALPTGLRIHCPSGHIVEMASLEEACGLALVLRAIDEAAC